MSNTKNESEKSYTLRPLCAKDIFPLARIISKIGINQFAGCFQSAGVKNLISAAKGGASMEDTAQVVGIGVVLELANVVLGNLSACEKDLYVFLSGLSGLSKRELEELPIQEFLQLVLDVLKLEGFQDFFKAAGKLLKSGS